MKQPGFTRVVRLGIRPVDEFEKWRLRRAVHGAFRTPTQWHEANDIAIEGADRLRVAEGQRDATDAERGEGGMRYDVHVGRSLVANCVTVKMAIPFRVSNCPGMHQYSHPHALNR